MKMGRLSFIRCFSLRRRKEEKREVWKAFWSRWENFRTGKSWRCLGRPGHSTSGREEGGGTEYETYCLSVREWIRYSCQGAAVCALFAYVFYRNFFSFFLFLPLGLLYPLYKRIDLKQRRQEELKRQFKESVLMLSSSLAAGYSMENSFAQAQAQLEEMYGERGMMSKEFAVMRSQLSMNRTLEELWGDFAKRSGIEEIRSFAQIFKAARRSGGQLGMIISHVSEIIGGKIQVQEEIRLMTAQKQFEQKIMNLLPLLIVLYIDLTSPGFFDTMYQTAAGRIVMTVCMLVYAGAYILAGRMLDIEI